MARINRASAISSAGSGRFTGSAPRWIARAPLGGPAPETAGGAAGQPIPLVRGFNPQRGEVKRNRAGGAIGHGGRHRAHGGKAARNAQFDLQTPRLAL